MEIRGKTFLVLGGAGLVGTAICRRLLEHEPARIVVSSLHQHEVDDCLDQLRHGFGDSPTELVGSAGNLFVRHDLSDTPRGELMASAEHRRAILDDTLSPLSPAILKRSHLFRVLDRHRPHGVIDCVNTATALAYQDLYRSARGVLEHLDDGHGIESFRAELERHLCTLYTPQLIRHIQILHGSLTECGVAAYVKIGTSGTGGMGLNIPYTHSEERPSRMLLSKAAMAGAHTLLLFLMARTPGGPVVKEVKPAAAIAWKTIGYGPIRRGGEAVRRFDCDPAEAIDLEREMDLGDSRRFDPLPGDDGVLRSVYADTGENGMFSRAEFEVLTSIGQMEFVTPEEIATNVVFEIRGINSGHDVITALDHTAMGPTYRAGVLRQTALNELRRLEREHGVQSVAFEMLGPPRLSKLLFEAELLRRTVTTLEAVESTGEEELSRRATELIRGDATLRSEILSVGLPILLPDGRRLLRGPRMVIPTEIERQEATAEAIDRWSHEGWVDLRPSNFARWRDRMTAILAERRGLDPDDHSSQYDRDPTWWDSEPEINIGKVLGWLFISEERGLRMKT